MKYDAVVCAGPQHQQIAVLAVRSLMNYATPGKIFVITAASNFGHFKRLEFNGPSIVLVDEDQLMDGVNLGSLKEYFKRRGGDPARAGWYFQQFLKMAMCYLEDVAEDYLIWDSDTVLLTPVSFFDTAGKSLVNPTNRYHRPYFDLAERLLGVERMVEYSFISEHLMIKKEYMRRLIGEIQQQAGRDHWTTAILHQVTDEHLGGAGFSEFETYGNYVHRNFRDSYVVRPLRSLRSGAKRTGPSPRSQDLLCLSRKFDYVSFEVWTRPKKWVRAIWKIESSLYFTSMSFIAIFSARMATKLRTFNEIAH